MTGPPLHVIRKGAVSCTPRRRCGTMGGMQCAFAHLVGLLLGCSDPAGVESAVDSGIADGADDTASTCDSASAGWQTWYVDADGDSFGNSALTREGCVQQEGEVSAGGDCDDASAAVNPGTVEACANGIDEDCDGVDDGCGPVLSLEVNEDTPRVYGSAGRALGSHVATGDLDGDGVADIVAGTGDSGYGPCGGSVAFGPVSGGHDIDEVGVRLTDEDVECSSAARVAVGDLDADGMDDVVVGRVNVANEYQYGSLWVGLGPIAHTGRGNAGETVLFASYYDGFGQSIAVADVTGDGVADLLTAAGMPCDHGVFVSRTMPSDEPEFWVYTDWMDCFFDMSVTGGGDADGDGVADVLGAYGSTAGTEVYLIPGGSTGAIPNNQLPARYTMEPGAVTRGAEVAFGDLNDDGLSDAVIRVSQGALGGYGDVYVVYGPGTAVTDVGGADVIVRGDSTGANGSRAMVTGDADGNGVADLLLGSGVDGLAASLYLGPLPTGTLSNSADVAFRADIDGSEYVGAAVGLADVDGDGVNEVLLGAPQADEGGADGGAVYAASGW